MLHWNHYQELHYTVTSKTNLPITSIHCCTCLLQLDAASVLKVVRRGVEAHPLPNAQAIMRRAKAPYQPDKQQNRSREREKKRGKEKRVGPAHQPAICAFPCQVDAAQLPDGALPLFHSVMFLTRFLTFLFVFHHHQHSSPPSCSLPPKINHIFEMHH